jgi:hypothetical protein
MLVAGILVGFAFRTWHEMLTNPLGLDTEPLPGAPAPKGWTFVDCPCCYGTGHLRLGENAGVSNCPVCRGVKRILVRVES